jgi:hypothetical protein
LTGSAHTFPELAGSTTGLLVSIIALIGSYYTHFTLTGQELNNKASMGYTSQHTINAIIFQDIKSVLGLAIWEKIENGMLTKAERNRW